MWMRVSPVTASGGIRSAHLRENGSFRGCRCQRVGEVVEGHEDRRDVGRGGAEVGVPAGGVAVSV